MTAPARVHRCNQLESRGIGDVYLGAGDANPARLERLPKGFECGAVKLRQFIEKQDALMS